MKLMFPWASVAKRVIDMVISHQPSDPGWYVVYHQAGAGGDGKLELLLPPPHAPVQQHAHSYAPIPPFSLTFSTAGANLTFQTFKNLVSA